MNNKWYQLLKGIDYYLFSKHGRGYGIHSPFIYDFIRNVLLEACSYDKCSPVKKEFKAFASKIEYLVSNHNIGAGSNSIANNNSFKRLAKTSGLPKKYLSLLCRIVDYYQFSNLLELGTCCGLTSATLASSRPDIHVTTVEGNEDRFNLAKQFFQHLELKNVTSYHNQFNSQLRELKTKDIFYDLIFIDGDHTYDATVKNYDEALLLLKPNGIIVLDDIYWSKGMTEAWEYVKSSNSAVVTIDLYRLGIVFLDRKQAKQHFTIRY